MALVQVGEMPLPAGGRQTSVTRSTFPLVYQGRSCALHRSVDRLVETDECLDCVGPRRLREMQDAEERRQKDRRAHRLLHELSDGGQTVLQLVQTTRWPAAEIRRLLEELAALGFVAFAEERFGHHSRWLWTRLHHSSNHQCTGWRKGLRCGHRRQAHPLHGDALLVCAWPGCSEGTARSSIQVKIAPRSSISCDRVVQFERAAAGDGGPPYRWREAG